ncbi:YqcI/YcgG family protein [Gracilibacillus xinjiangensis]|uniref:YqcI/YcgG family protein n=1 Tax=Gracilibacillus xinjiangensis TaxID=1193282 RepID=A0ABV8WWS6_9BACI
MSEKDKPFPCIPATIGHTLQHFRYGFIGCPTKKETVQELAGLLNSYTEQSREFGKYTSLVVFYELSEGLKERFTVEQYEQLFWQQLNSLSVMDLCDWPSNIPDNAENTLWEFCFQKERYFVYCATPAHKERKSRKFDTMMLALTPRWVFDLFNDSNKQAPKIKDKIRGRIGSYDTVAIHPELRKYGAEDNFEWKQYFLRDDNTSLLKCPFHRDKP